MAVNAGRMDIHQSEMRARFRAADEASAAEPLGCTATRDAPIDVSVL
jgi:hypothetical protein